MSRHVKVIERAREQTAALIEVLADRDRALDLTRDRARGLDRALVQARDCAVRLVQTVSVIRARVRDLQAVTRLLPDAAVLRICGVDLTLSPALGSDWNPLTEDLEAVERVAQTLYSVLMAIRIDASYADLSRLDLGGESRKALNGVVWTAYTRWPEGLRAFVERNSLKIGDGIYQITPGTAHDSAGIAVLA